MVVNRANSRLNAGRSSSVRLNQSISKVIGDSVWVCVLQFEYAFNDTELRSGGIETRNSNPVVNNHTCTNNGRSTVHGTCHQRNLEKRREFLLVLDRGLWMNQTSSVGESAIGSNKNVTGNGLSENLHS
ncbi:hypothetical protein OGAPHI_004617 [Ogataea philodendri]|uniref:Uncharacterized protein n=1 Tax=Ogataea philodendri TaxID=1378263 RepID=A0A9P8T3R2_9ASCO|nr:uncharacterized protein OGAPHI_004617 [Ogataea philodendri]KAH3664265.1 hypothetical protein OGAPHI_004617 [Ogataea philodendri]